MSWWVTKTASNGGSCAGDSWDRWGPYGSKKNRSPNECEKDDFKSFSVHLICGRRNGSTQTDERAVCKRIPAWPNQVRRSVLPSNNCCGTIGADGSLSSMN